MLHSIISHTQQESQHTKRHPHLGHPSKASTAVLGFMLLASNDCRLQLQPDGCQEVLVSCRSCCSLPQGCCHWHVMKGQGRVSPAPAHPGNGLRLEKRKESTTPVGVNTKRRLVIYQAVQKIVIRQVLHLQARHCDGMHRRQLLAGPLAGPLCIL